MDKNKTKTSKEKEPALLGGELFYWAQALAVALVLLVIINTFFFRLSGVRGTSMYDTLDNGDQLILRVIGYDEPQRGDIVVCTSDAFGGEALVKRVIAVAGDTVDIRSDGTVVVNGQALTEPYIYETIDGLHRGDQTYPVPIFRKAFIGVVLAQKQAVFRAGSHHAVGFVCPLGDEIVYQRAEIGTGARQNERLLSFYAQRGIDTGQKSLRGGFFIAGSAVELPCSEKPRNIFEFQRGAELKRIAAIVFNGIRITHDFSLFKARQAVKHFFLHIGRHGG